jgi:predicted dehydrogenase
MAIRTVVVGMGPRGRDWIREIQQNKEFKLVGCVEVDKQVLQHATRTSSLNGSPAFTNLSQALEGNDVQAVIVATPPEAHLEPCRIALTKKIGVMVEKPFTTTLSDAITLVRLAENSTPLLVAQNYRYLRAFRAARDLVIRGVLGPVGLALHLQRSETVVRGRRY